MQPHTAVQMVRGKNMISARALFDEFAAALQFPCYSVTVPGSAFEYFHITVLCHWPLLYQARNTVFRPTCTSTMERSSTLFSPSRRYCSSNSVRSKRKAGVRLRSTSGLYCTPFRNSVMCAARIGVPGGVTVGSV
jgi:hypothetical protein